MSLHLSRRALYELVWSRPRAQLARELGVSDVWIGKQCRAMDVPAPPRGYWTQLHAARRSKARFVRPPLTYTLSQRMLEDREDAEAPYAGFKARDLAQPLPPPPVYAADEPATVARYLAMARKELSRRRTEGRHPVVQALIDQDERRASPQYARPWLQPLYRGPKGDTVVKAIDSLAWAWTRCGWSVSASAGHEIELTVSGGGMASHFDLRHVAPTTSNHRQTRTQQGQAAAAAEAGLGFWLYSGYQARDPKARPLRIIRRMTVAVVVELTELLLVQWESRYRTWLEQRYSHLAQARADVLRQLEEAQRQERERIRAAQRALEQRRRHLLRHAVASVRRADDIREMVAVLDARTGVQASPAWATWRTWALEQADAMDVRQVSAERLADWVAGFALQPPEGATAVVEDGAGCLERVSSQSPSPR